MSAILLRYQLQRYLSNCILSTTAFATLRGVMLAHARACSLWIVVEVHSGAHGLHLGLVDNSCMLNLM
jgi:hypothetical protein